MSEKIYGRNPVLEAIRSGSRGVNRIFLMQGSRDGVLNQIEAHAKAKGIPITVETRHRLDTLAGTDKHQGVLAVVEDFHYADLQDVLDIAKKKKENPFLLLLDEIEDPHNLGAILRSADAAGAHGAVIPKNRAVEVNSTVLKASAGAAEHIPTVKVTNLNETIRELKEANIWVVGTDADASKNFYEYDFKGPVAIVIGNEGKGLRRLVSENCDELVKIPMAGKMSSLNASVAAALMLFEVARQRNWGQGLPRQEKEVHFPSIYGSPRVIPVSPQSEIPPSPLYVPPTPQPTIVSTPLDFYAPPERDFFRSGPDPDSQAPAEGPSEILDTGNVTEVDETPRNDKGGGFKW
jgi:23S rRNA (guanosine2251-2'-O)-methyltransferase